MIINIFLNEGIRIPLLAMLKFLNTQFPHMLFNWDFSWFFTVWSTSEPCILSHVFLQWCCSYRVQYKTDWNFGLLVVYIGEISPNRELSKRAQALGGSGVGSGRTNESFSAKNRLHWTLQNREGTEICIIWRNHRCFSTRKHDSALTKIYWFWT